jgi:uncharacterized protein YukE
VAFEASIQQLRATSNDFNKEARTWLELAGQLQSWRLDALDLGVIGKTAGIIDIYNDALSSIQDRFGKNLDALEASADALDSTADTYEGQDHQIADDLHKMAQPHG